VTRPTPFSLHLALLALGTALPGAALAQSACTSTGNLWTCQGSGSGINNGSLDGATIDILPGAQIDGGANQGIQVDDNNIITNDGTITSTGDHAVQGDNGVTVTNRGTITGGSGDDGVNIDDDGVLINSGTITGGDDGVQLEANAYVLNEETGRIQAAGEAVNVNTDGAVVINHGTIIGGDDGINAGENAEITNTGRILSNGGAQDGVDLDSGSVTNSGQIIAEGVEDGIDFDISVIASTVTNTGTIEGNLAINNDPGNTAALTVINAGTLIGRGGLAIDFGAGDDGLVLRPGSRITGAIEFGTGNDTLEIVEPMATMLSFASAPETITAGGPIVTDASGLISFDAAGLSLGDDMALNAGRSLALAVLDRDFARGAWVAGYGFASGAGEDGLQGYSGTGAGLLLGYDLSDRFGAFLSLGRAASDLEDGLQSATQDQLLLGLRGQTAVAGMTLSGTAFAGTIRTDFDSADDVAGQGSTDGLLMGAALRADGKLGETLDFAAQVSVLRHKADAYSLTGVQTASFDERVATTAALRLELGIPVEMKAARLRPYAALTIASGSSDEIVASGLGGTTRFAAADWQDGTSLALGATYDAAIGAGQVNGRIEVEFSDDRDPELRVGLGLSIPFGG
jgi:hypothetical protein